jgi:hypothetical protein
VLPARAISTKNKHLLVVYSTPARGFTAAVSVFRGTPPPKPLICKSVLIAPGARVRLRWAESTGGKPSLSCARIRFVPSDIIKTSPDCRSLSVHLFGSSFIIRSGKQKTLPTRGKQGCGNLFRFVTCLPPEYPIPLPGIARKTIWSARGLTHSRDCTGYDGSLSRRSSSAKS